MDMCVSIYTYVSNHSTYTVVNHLLINDMLIVMLSWAFKTAEQISPDCAGGNPRVLESSRSGPAFAALWSFREETESTVDLRRWDFGKKLQLKCFYRALLCYEYYDYEYYNMQKHYPDTGIFLICSFRALKPYTHFCGPPVKNLTIELFSLGLRWEMWRQDKISILCWQGHQTCHESCIHNKAVLQLFGSLFFLA